MGVQSRFRPYFNRSTQYVFALVHISLHTYLHTHAHTLTHVYTHTRAYTHVHTHTCTHILHACTYTHNFRIFTLYFYLLETNFFNFLPSCFLFWDWPSCDVTDCFHGNNNIYIYIYIQRPLLKCGSLTSC